MLRAVVDPIDDAAGVSVQILLRRWISQHRIAEAEPSVPDLGDLSMTQDDEIGK